MSFSFCLYRAAEGLGPMSQWNQMHATALGSVDAVKLQVANVFPDIVWERRAGGWSGLGPNAIGGPYLDVRLSEEEPGACLFVVLNKAAPSVMRSLMEAMHLNYVYAPEADDLVDPYAYDDEARYYVKKVSQP